MADRTEQYGDWPCGYRRNPSAQQEIGRALSNTVRCLPRIDLGFTDAEIGIKTRAQEICGEPSQALHHCPFSQCFEPGVRAKEPVSFRSPPDVLPKRRGVLLVIHAAPAQREMGAMTG